MKFVRIDSTEVIKNKKDVLSVKAQEREKVVLVVDNLRSNYNIGSLFRTCDAFMVEKIYLCGISGTPPNKEIEKTSLGATETVPHEYYDSTIECLKELKAKGWELVAIEISKGSKNILEAKLNKKSAFIIGNEVDGLSQEVLDIADNAVYIPMNGRANSLNVANAASIVLFEMHRQNYGQRQN